MQINFFLHQGTMFLFHSFKPGRFKQNVFFLMLRTLNLKSKNCKEKIGPIKLISQIWRETFLINQSLFKIVISNRDWKWLVVLTSKLLSNTFEHVWKEKADILEYKKSIAWSFYSSGSQPNNLASLQATIYF